MNLLDKFYLHRKNNLIILNTVMHQKNNGLLNRIFIDRKPMRRNLYSLNVIRKINMSKRKANFDIWSLILEEKLGSINH